MRRCKAGLTLLLSLLFALGASECTGAGQGRRAEAPAPEQAGTAEAGAEATVMVYMVGSDLESESALGTLDLEEMARADLGAGVNLVIQTMGCTDWHNEAVSPATAQRFAMEGGELVCLQGELGQLDSTQPATLADFIAYCAGTFPARRYILVFWDHGAGPVYGFGYDEYRPAEALTLDEIRAALEKAGVHFDLIGFDACLMGCLETCCALQEWADYLIASEDFVSSYGWEYQYWLTELGDDPAMTVEELGRTIVDTYVRESEQAGDPGVLALIDLRYVPALYAAWTEFAYANTGALTGRNYTWPTQITRREAGPEWDGAEVEVMENYYIADLMALACALDCPERLALETALSDAVVCSASDRADQACSGLAVTLPYGDRDFYASLAEVYPRCGLDQHYVDWLACFVSAPGAGQFYDRWEDWGELWDNSSSFGGWFGYEHGSAWRARRAAGG